ncbi:MAG: TrkA C-terminal domain-containing protein [Candidatus Marinimicrobia bacterium]|nr:TrkA C-terminal domain-containing protein [Candidatus Neomarinimicrobiota bacterium]
MKLWKKMRGGAAAVAALTKTQVEVSEVSQLQAEVDELRAAIGVTFTGLGSAYYDYASESKVEGIPNEIDEQLKLLFDMHHKLAEKEQQLAGIKAEYEEQTLSLSHFREFKEALDEAGGSIEYVTVEESSPFLYRTVSEMGFPEDILAGMIIRMGNALIPGGDTRIEVNDKIVLLGKKEAVVGLLHKFKSEGEQEIVPAKNDEKDKPTPSTKPGTKKATAKKR